MEKDYTQNFMVWIEIYGLKVYTYIAKSNNAIYRDRYVSKDLKKSNCSNFSTNIFIASSFDWTVSV